jgi:tetratricopeptide (TPR) repeat protein
MIHAGRLQEHLPELAYHFGRAAAGAGDVETAIRYHAQAGDAALDQLASDQAADYFRQALMLLERVAPSTESRSRRADLLCALGEAQRRADFPEYRQTLLDAADVAQELGDTDRLARAAQANSRGLFSVTWGVDAERERVMRAALEALGENDTPARARLLANLAVERVYVGEYDQNRRLSDEALAMARRLGDPETLAWVLSPRYMTIRSDPATLPERLANTAELLDVATSVGDPAMIAFAWGWRGLAAMEAGEILESHRCFERFEAAGLELRQPVFLWFFAFLQAARLILFGHLDEAQRLANEARELGTAGGQPDAGLVFNCQMFQLCFERGALAAIEPQLLGWVAANPAAGAIAKCFLALLYSETERPDEARQLYDEAAMSRFGPLSGRPSWLYTLSVWVLVCSSLRDQDGAEVLLDVLAPYADQIVTMSSLAYTGSVHHYLGLLSAVLDRREEAIHHFASAAEIHQRIGAPAWLARTQLGWAQTLLGSCSSKDRAAAGRLVLDAVVTAERLGLREVGRQAHDLHALTGARDPSSDDSSASERH